jgi:hypothetical protein
LGGRLGVRRFVATEQGKLNPEVANPVDRICAKDRKDRRGGLFRLMVGQSDSG